jgi:hypothetical protein
MTYLSPKINIVVGGKVIGSVTYPASVEVEVKEQKIPAAGQVWKHDYLPNYKIKILVANDRHLEVECVESGIDAETPGDKHVVEEDVLHKFYTLCESSFKSLYGDTCTKCKRDYPHAVKQANFVCWGCKNGC